MYNVVLNIPGLQTTERHPHSKPVAYVPKDKDATVSYSSVDFKFKNNTGYSIKIYTTSTPNDVTVRFSILK